MENPKLCKLRAEALSLQKLYRCALRAVGKGSNYHIYNLSPAYLKGLPFAPEVSFLQRLQTYYSKSDLFERKVLLFEVLERGAHYPFWFVPDIGLSEYLDYAKSVVEKVHKTAYESGVLS